MQKWGVTDMKTQSRMLVALLGSLACFSYVNTANADSKGHAHSGHLRGDVIPVEIYDPLGLVAPNGQLISLAKGFSFTEGPANDRHGNVFFTDQPNDKI